MSQTIPKINKLKNPESFVQINLIKGFKYVDRAGEIVNLYHKNNTPPQFTMNLSGLQIDEPLEKVDQLKITSSSFWMKFSEAESLDLISQTFKKEAEKIVNILDVEEINRIGWRNYFIYEFKDEEEQNTYLKKFSVVEKIKPVSMRFELETGKDFKATFIIQPVIKEDDNKTRGVLFDLDLFKDTDTEVKNLYKVLQDFREYLKDDGGFLGVVNATFEK